MYSTGIILLVLTALVIVYVAIGSITEIIKKKRVLKLSDSCYGGIVLACICSAMLCMMVGTTHYTSDLDTLYAENKDNYDIVRVYYGEEDMIDTYEVFGTTHMDYFKAK